MSEYSEQHLRLGDNIEVLPFHYDMLRSDVSHVAEHVSVFHS